MSNGIVARLAILVGIIFCALAAVQAKDGFGADSFWLIVLGLISVFAGLMLTGRK